MRRTLLLLLIAFVSTSAVAVGQANPPAPTALPDTIPIFPLEEPSLFPGMTAPFHIYEPRYRAMIADALKGNRIIGMTTLRPGYEKDYEKSPSIFPIGCAGVIDDVEQLANGEYNITIRAIAKFRVTREEASKPYRIAHVTVIQEPLEDADKPALHMQRQRIEQIVSTSNGKTGVGAVPPNIDDDEVVNGVSQFANLDEVDRQTLLEQPTALARANALVPMLEKLVAGN
jgi:Lon protease-like protein